MRIAHVVPRGEQPWSGVLTVIVHLAAALAERGHHVEVWQMHEWSRDVYAEQHSRLKTAGVVEVPVRERPGNATGLARERGIDVVHLHGAFNPTNTAFSRRLLCPYVFSPHSGYDPVSLQRSRTRKLLYRALFERSMLEKASLLVALTDAELDDLRRFGASGPVEVIPNGVAPPMTDLDRAALRRELAIPHDALLAVFVGRLDVHRKGLDVLVRGVAAAPGWHLALIGPAFRDVDRLGRLVADLSIADRVHLVGERHGRELQGSVAAADVLTMLSRWEGLPMALLEGLSLSIPAIVSPPVERAVGVESAGAGWVVDEEGLGPLLVRLMRSDRTELSRRGDAAAHLAERFDWDDVAERYEDAYGRAIGIERRVSP